MAATDFTIADVLQWARTKPADETYSYSSIHHCAIAQFVVHATGEVFPDGRGRLEQGQVGDAASEFPNTFGGFVARLEGLCPDQIVTPSEWTKLDAYLTDIEMARA